MTNREIVKELTGEDAEDIFGGDCDNEMEELNENPDDVVGVGDEKMKDEEATEMGLSAMERETERCAQEFMLAVKRWAEVAHSIMDKRTA